MKEVVSETSQYRVTMEVPRVAREGTSWRTLAVKGSYSEVGRPGRLPDRLADAGGH